MRIKSTAIHNRQGWLLDNGVIKLFLMKGGGHIAGLRLKGVEKVNPFWAPPWKSIEPWEYDQQRDGKRYGIKLLACIYGHNLCLSAFGDPSPDEEKSGITCHYEAPVARWSLFRKKITARSISLEYGCLLPAAQMKFIRTATMRAGSNVINVRETIQNMARRDVPFTICQHVTFGPPFLEPGVTAFDMPSAKGHTFPAKFGSPQRLKIDHDFKWPKGPGLKGGVDHAQRVVNLRFAGKNKYGDFYANLMNTRREQAWFSAVNPCLGLLIAYVWRRADYPWVGVWEENRARKAVPWNGKSLTRGMEFANTPFPIGLRKSVDLGRFFGEKTFAWLPARGKVVHDYSILAARVDKNCAGVAEITAEKQKFEVKLFAAFGHAVRTIEMPVE